MTLRHAAALALVGWYLMVPPDGPTPSSPLYWHSYSPLSRWQIVEPFDTAAACKDAANKLTEDAVHIWNSSLGKKLDKDSEKDLIFKWGRELSASCFATDDPRLKGN